MKNFPYNKFNLTPTGLALVIFRGYQLFISPVLPGICRFHPTCSQYAVDAFTQYGFFKGAWLSLKRIGKCHPWGQAGLDPVPKQFKNHVEKTSCHHISLR